MQYFFYGHWNRSVKFESPIFILSPQFKPHNIIFTYVTCPAPNRAAGSVKSWCDALHNPGEPSLSAEQLQEVLFSHIQLTVSPLYPCCTERAVTKVSIPELKLLGLSLAKEKHHYHIMPNLPVKLWSCCWDRDCLSKCFHSFMIQHTVSMSPVFP